MRAMGKLKGKLLFTKDNGAGFDMKRSGLLFTLSDDCILTRNFREQASVWPLSERVIERHGGRIWQKVKSTKEQHFILLSTTKVNRDVRRDGFSQRAMR